MALIKSINLDGGKTVTYWIFNLTALFYKPWETTLKVDLLGYESADSYMKNSIELTKTTVEIPMQNFENEFDIYSAIVQLDDWKNATQT